MSSQRPWRNLRLALAALLALIGSFGERSARARERPFDGFNIIAVPGHPFGSPSSERALADAKSLGARAIAVIPFLWQADPASPDIARGEDMTDGQLRAAIADAHALDLAVVVKPQVWISKSWAGAVAMTSQAAWQKWFANYQKALVPIARVAEQQHAEALAIGTELAKTTQQPEWNEVIAAVRSVYHGRLLYVAHNVAGAETVPFWTRLDTIGVTLYPPLGADDDRDGRRNTMHAIADRLDALAAQTGKPILVSEIGLRSAVGASAKPWESPEERRAAPDPALQAQVLADWLDILDRPSIQGVLIWRWFTDAAAGGPNDTDFTVQGKPAERVLTCAWTHRCSQREGRLSSP